MTEIAQLESSALFWDWVSYISLIIAFLAALAEFITNWTTWIEDDWKSKVEKNAALIVVVGSVVGLVTAWKLSNINNRLNDHLRGEVAGAQEKAGQAMTAFANAQTRLEEGKARTALAEKAAAEALKKANEAEGHALKFKAEIASSNARAEEAKLLAERERSERVKLEANVAPRRLTQQQQNAMAKSLRQFKGRSVTVVTYTLDVEAAFLAKQLMIALEAAGIVIEDKVANIPVALLQLRRVGRQVRRDALGVFVRSVKIVLGGHADVIGTVKLAIADNLDLWDGTDFLANQLKD